MTSKDKLKEKFEKWYYSQKFVPHGLMWTNHSFEGFKQGYNQALKDIEKIGRNDSPASIRPTDKYFIFISQKRWEKLKAKGE